MRALLIVPVVILLTAGAGWGIVAAVQAPVSVKELVMAALACLAAGELAMVPLILARNTTQATVSQAALAGTVIHLLASIALAGGAMLVIHPAAAFVYWMLGFYWVTLIVLVVAFVRAVKSAPVSQTGK